ncbi:ABC transporter ATP-binding protein [Blastopirellula marina]|uniref:ABC transporter ATP-binding protein n=1 Tax=Blastopirellula marina TaxID=124 RepID=A0A2S8G2X2_9BACT|nr:MULTISPECIES: polysaccharide ABC transporter ATP-binding protein [Pirellulaceae]PQO38799.1 ABC transporter ATP-binding protein [Blastopirellula marina]RCS55107.1 ATP-binding cassette domain-containing protein [Bremerella cremea]
MQNPAIRVEGLGKKFKIGTHQYGHRLTELISGYARSAITAPAKYFGGQSNSVTHTPAEFWAFRNLNFNIQAGDVVGIIGRNGAGKSTLLKVLSRITEPTEGRFGVRGRISSLLEVGTGFHPELTGRENVYLSGVVLGMKRAEIKRKFDQIVAFSGTEKFLDTPVKRFSSGMQVRLGFAVAAFLEPEILIVDEVLAVGDHEFQKKCLGKMSDIAQEGRTILFVSHNAGAVKQMCTRCIWLRDGSVHSDGDPQSVLTDYMSPDQGDLYHLPVQGNLGVEVRSVSLNEVPLRIDRRVRFTSPFDLTFEIASQASLPNLQLAVRIGKRETPLCELNTAYDGNCVSVDSDDLVSVTCHIHSLPLLPGTYDLSLKISGTGLSRDLLPWTPVGELEVIPNLENEDCNDAQFHRPFESRPPVHCAHTWAVRQREPLTTRNE